MAPPTPKQLSDISAALDGLIAAVEEHDQWKATPRSQALFYVHDFCSRSKYLLSEYENIKAGNPVQHPDQFRPAPGSGENAAVKVFDDVCGRTMMIQMIIEDTSGKAAMMTGGGPPLEYGPNIKAKFQELEQVVPKDHMMAGMMG